MKTLVFLLEEPSAKVMLEVILSRYKTNFEEIKYIDFPGKQSLEKNIYNKIQLWQKPNTIFIIMRDQDSGDCKVIKQGIVEKIKSITNPNVSNIIIRIACRELESFYLGDLLAVEKAFKIPNLSKQQSKKKYREPDNLNNAKQELRKITKGEYQPLKGSREIAQYMDLERNNSKSFNVLISSIFQKQNFIQSDNKSEIENESA